MKIFWGILLSVFSVNALAAPSFSVGNRQEYLKGVLLVIQEAAKRNIDEIAQWISIAEKSKCKSVSDSLTLSCLREEIKNNCNTGDAGFKKICPVLSDVMLVNSINEKLFVSLNERIKLSATKSDDGSGYEKLLRRKYALLTTEFLSMSKQDCPNGDLECTSSQIDQYCAKNADVKNLSWQACASAIVWFIGTSSTSTAPSHK